MNQIVKMDILSGNPERKEQMSRKRIAVLIASVDREYQQDFVSGLEKAASKRDMDICIS